MVTQMDAGSDSDFMDSFSGFYNPGKKVAIHE